MNKINLRDHLTNEEAIEFWERYLSEIESN